MPLPKPHPHKGIYIDYQGKKIARYPIGTKVFMKGDHVPLIVKKAITELLPLIKEQNVIVAVSEKAVSASQGRAYFIKDLHPTWLAKFLVKFVTKSKHGIGLGSPYTMQIALWEVGIPRILLATLVAALTKPFGIKGMFYRVAGKQARSIDGPADYVIPPYNKAAVLGAREPDKLCAEISKANNNIGVFIMDSNDLGRNIIGTYNLDKEQLRYAKAAFKDNFWGSTREQTPVGLIAWD